MCKAIFHRVLQYVYSTQIFLFLFMYSEYGESMLSFETNLKNLSNKNVHALITANSVGTAPAYSSPEMDQGGVGAITPDDWCTSYPVLEVRDTTPL